MTTCSVCSKEVETMTHEYFEGTPKESQAMGGGVARIWQVEAPLYFLAADNTTRMVKGFCGPVCATRHKEEQEVYKSGRVVRM